jgi:hypothetical protein
MNNAIRIKMAEAEGWTYIGVTADEAQSPIGQSPWTGITKATPIPAYDNDNDLDRFIRGVSGSMLRGYFLQLEKIVGGGIGNEHMLFLATVEQKQEAIIKAMGWEEVK